MPSTDKEEATRNKVLSDNEAPSSSKSSTASVEPTLDFSTRDMVDPKRAKLLSETEAPTAHNPRTDTVDAKRQNVRRDSDDPT